MVNLQIMIADKKRTFSRTVTFRTEVLEAEARHLHSNCKREIHA